MKKSKGSPAGENGKRILVFGDAMIDRAWVVAEPAETSQAHADVLPHKVVDPTTETDRPGGAGLTAEWLAWSKRHEVRLLASVGTALSSLLQEEHARVVLFPEHIKGGRRDTTKFRVYAYQGEKRHPPLRYRFDFDMAPEADFGVPQELESPDVILVADFQKGAVTSDRLEALAKRCPGARWLVDSKNASIVQLDVWKLVERPTLFVNRQEFSATCDAAAKRGTNARTGRFDIASGKWQHIERTLLGGVEEFTKRCGGWDLVIKLDSEGAVAIWKQSGTWRFARAAAPSIEGATTIGAGDAFIAGWTSALLSNKEPQERLAEGVRHASAWIQVTEKMTTLSRPRDVPDPSSDAVSYWPRITPTKPIPLEEWRERVGEANEFKALAHGINLGAASGVCGRFMATDPHVRLDVRAFADEIRSYFLLSGARRPLNCLVWAAPGSGKSFLVEEVAGDVGVAFREINIATMSDLAELKTRLEQVSTADEGSMLVMLDELTAQVGNQYVFSSLLAPLWNKPKAKKLAFVLVDSGTEGMKEVSELEKLIQRDSKGKDLLSRINGPKLSLTKPNALDRAYLVASLIRRLHPKTAFRVETRALRALVRPDEEARDWSPRAMEYIIQAINPSGGTLRFRDLLEHRDLCRRMGVTVSDVDDGDREAIEIVDK